MSTLPDYALVNGVAYKRAQQDTRSSANWAFIRMSVPPDATPGKKSRWKPVYKMHQVPEYQEITREQAEEISRVSVEAWEQKLREEART